MNSNKALELMREEIRSELKSIRADTSAVRETLARHEVIIDKQEKNLSEHMKRTDALEKFTAKWAGAWSLLGALGVVTGIVYTVARMLGKA